MDAHQILDIFSALGNGIIWLGAVVITYLRLKKNHLEGTERNIYIVGGVSALIYASVNIVDAVFRVPEGQRAHTLQTVEPFIATTVILFMLFYRDKQNRY